MSHPKLVMKRFMGVAAVAVLAACGGSSPSAPSPTTSAVVLEVSPNPVNSVGLSTICENATAPEKTWVYTMTIRSTNGVPFNVTGFRVAATVPGFSQPVVVEEGPRFASIFRSATVPASGSLTATLCVRGTSYDSSSLVWTLTGSPGGPFSSPAIQLRP